MGARLAGAGLALLALAACQPAPPGTPAGSASCGAESLQTLVGQSAGVLETMRFAGPVRIIRPGMAVTMDYRPDRLNIEIDAANTIARVWCS